MQKVMGKTRNNQIPYAIALIGVMVFIGIILLKQAPNVASYWFIGMVFGVLLQRGRLCFTALWRDPILTGRTENTRAVLAVLMFMTVFFAVIQYSKVIQGQPTPGLIAPAGLHTIFGGIIFGIGMVIASGCASGTLWRVGEGFVMSWITVPFFIIGSVLGAGSLNWWAKFSFSRSVTVHLPTVFGWIPGVLLQLLALGGLFFLAAWWDKRNSI